MEEAIAAVYNNKQPYHSLAAILPPPPPPSPPPRKYISMFRIDGVPILPPLMTNEKKRQMQKIKEKAIKLEQKFKEKRNKKLQFRDDIHEIIGEILPETPRSQGESIQSGSNSQRSDDDASTHQEDEEDPSYVILSNLMRNNDECEQSNAELCTNALCMSQDKQKIENNLQKDNFMERMQKLRKSETLIYDNCSNTIMMPLTDSDEQQKLLAGQKFTICNESSTTNNCEKEERANLNYFHPAKPTNFTLDLPNKQIPSICVNPPTPVVGIRSFCDELCPTQSEDSIGVIKTSNDIKEISCTDDFSSDESFNCIQNYDLKSNKKITNITAKILEYENLQKMVETNDKLSMEPPGVKPAKRSATSPSLKPITVESPKCALDVSVTSTSENPIIRSNSFTLDSPSKALLDHIQQQQQQQKKLAIKQRRYTPSPSATRDTVESKAKRVQKVELKPRPPPMRIQMKSSTSTFSNNTAAHAHNNNNKNSIPFKNRRSPYELKTVSRTRLKKAASVTVAGCNKQSVNASSSPATPESVKSSPIVSSDLLSGIEADHRLKFEKLIAQQQREQKRLQQSFEMQQKLLLEQLTAELNKSHIQSKCKATPDVNTMTQVASAEPISVEHSPNTSSELTRRQTSLKSPALSLNSSIISSSIDTTSHNNISEEFTLPSLDISTTCSTVPSTTPNTNYSTPRRRLFACENASVSITENTEADNGTATALTSSSANRRLQQQLYNEHRIAAATKINACARGFLVRRLFQTEQIQRIVQTIRDTLIFVLNLHLETRENPAEAQSATNIKLKARLLQQLSSASRTLHLVFFQTTIKERMEIIARDRKRMRTKLMAMNIKRQSPRFAK